MRPIQRNLIAQLYSRGVVIGVQIGMVPILIGTWGVDSYGVWLTLTAIPMYLTLSDFGFTFVAKNDMSMRVSQGDRPGALETYQSIFVLLVIGCLVLGTGLLALVYWLPLDGIFNLGDETLATAQTVLATQIVAVLFYQLFLLVNAGIRCEGRAATETAVTATSRLGEAAAWAITALLGGGLADAAIAGMVSRLVMLVATGTWVHAVTPWLKLGVSHATRARLVELAAPSLSYMLVPVGNTLLIQAPLIILGIFATPAVVALFGVTRTVARVGMQAANVVNFAFTPEYSFAYGRGETGRFLRNFRIHALVGAAGIVAFIALGIPLLPHGVSLLSGGDLVAETWLGVLMILAVAGEMVWSIFLSPLSAINRHKRFALRFAVICGAAIGLACVVPESQAIAAILVLAHGAIGLSIYLMFRPLRRELEAMRDKTGQDKNNEGGPTDANA